MEVENIENKGVENEQKDDKDDNEGILKAQVVSDLHLEMGGVFEEVKELIPVIGNILILPGDVGILGKDDFLEFFEWASKNYRFVLYVPVIDMMKENLKQYDNVHLLYRSSIVINGIRFIGTTFWTYPPNKRRRDMVYYRYNDYRHIKIGKSDEEKEEEEKEKESNDDIRYLTINDTMKFHQEDREWMISEFEKARSNHEDVYVISHHVPLLGLKFLWSGERNYINQDIWYGNCTDESELIAENMDVIKCWFHGHTHKSLVTTFRRSDIKNKELPEVKKKRELKEQEEEEEGEKDDDDDNEEEEENIWIISNQVGYKNGRDESEYNKDLVLEIPIKKPNKMEYPPIILKEGGDNLEIWGEVEVIDEKEEEEKKKRKERQIREKKLMDEAQKKSGCRVL